jgi:hypothetical protein
MKGSKVSPQTDLSKNKIQSIFLNQKLVYNNPYIDLIKSKIIKSNSLVGQRTSTPNEKPTAKAKIEAKLKAPNSNTNQVVGNLNLSSSNTKNLLSDDKFTNINIIVNNNYIKSVSESGYSTSFKNDAKGRNLNAKNSTAQVENAPHTNSKNKSFQAKTTPKPNDIKSSRKQSTNTSSTFANVNINLIKQSNPQVITNKKIKSNNQSNISLQNNNSFSPINITRASSKNNSKFTVSKHTSILSKTSSKYDTTSNKINEAKPEKVVSASPIKAQGNPVFIQNSYSQLSKKLNMNKAGGNTGRNSLQNTFNPNNFFYSINKKNTTEKESNAKNNNNVIKSLDEDKQVNTSNLSEMNYLQKSDDKSKGSEKKDFKPIQLIKNAPKNSTGLSSIRLVKSITSKEISEKEENFPDRTIRENSLVYFRQSMQKMEGPEELHFMHVELNSKQKKFVNKLEEFGEFEKQIEDQH